MALKSIDVDRPVPTERSEPGIHLHEWFGADPVKTPLCISARLHEASLSQHPKVLGDRGLRHSQPLFDVTHGELRGGEQTQDGAAARLGNDGERLFHIRYIHVYVYMCQGI